MSYLPDIFLHISNGVCYVVKWYACAVVHFVLPLMVIMSEQEEKIDNPSNNFNHTYYLNNELENQCL